MLAVRLPAISTTARPALSAIPVQKPQTPTVDDLWHRVEQLVLPALSEPTFERFFEVSKRNIGSFNNLMLALVDLLAEDDGALTPEDLASEVSDSDEELAEAIIASSGSLRRALAVRERLFGDRPLDELRDEGGPLHMFASFGTWHGWTLVSVALMLRHGVRLTEPVRRGLLNLMHETGRGAYVVLRSVEIERVRSAASQEEDEAVAELDPAVDELEHEAHLQAEEALRLAEGSGR
ncbi:MAG: hypothetical protein IPK13_20250 [Deltaproteobacteria bacterium]|nr:hypothetical protein [Deltaproteobacteria bacterium]